LLPLVLVTLYAVTIFAHSIEDAVRTRVRTVLDREGMGWASVEACGQNVLLRGTPPDPVEALRARQLAESTTCPTWLGEGGCTVEVRAKFDDVPVASASRASVGKEAAACDRDLAALSSRSQIQFETGRATIRAESLPLLEKIAELACRCPGRLTIEGHTDAIGSEEANVQLSRARAAAVRDQLVQRGLPPDELVTRGFGESRPVSSNDTEEGRARNRRIELHILLEGQRVREPKT
jgi:outer membrane protein OmpA-like peptidoglycan-associated protein